MLRTKMRTRAAETIRSAFVYLEFSREGGVRTA